MITTVLHVAGVVALITAMMAISAALVLAWVGVFKYGGWRK